MRIPKRAWKIEAWRPRRAEATPPPAQHADEPHEGSIASRLNWLRAGVLGANDGIVSTAGIVVGVAGATDDRQAILVAGVAGLFAGALSMATGEYVSVCTQRDTEQALLAKERRELARGARGGAGRAGRASTSAEGAQPRARDPGGHASCTAHDALAAHAEAELGIDPDDLTNPWHAAWASMLAFTVARCCRC